MEQKYRDFEKSIKREHSFRFTPQYKEQFSVQLKPRTFVEIGLHVFEKLKWEVVYSDENTVEATYLTGIGVRAFNILANINDRGLVEVKSVSIGNEMWDIGKNSLRVKLFIFAFNEELKTYDAERLQELEKEIVKKDNWDEYIIPESLPAPSKFKEPQFAIPIIGTILLALIIGYAFAFLNVELKRIIVIYEVLASLAFAYVLGSLIRFSNFTDWTKIRYCIGLGAVLICVFNELFQYQMILSKADIENIGFIDFIAIKLKQGFRLNSMNLGALGYIGVWIFQLVAIYFITHVKAFGYLISYSLERVPFEVTEFALYHFIKGKNEKEVRNELAKMGWKSEFEQNMVFEGIDAMQGAQELNRA